MGSFSVSRFDPIETARFLRSYLQLLIRSGESDIAGLPLTRGFHICRLLINERFGIVCDNDKELDELDCRIEWNGGFQEGKLKISECEFHFFPNETPETVSQSGSVISVRTENRLIKCVLVRQESDKVTLAPINGIEYRREFQRSQVFEILAGFPQVSGLALVHLPEREFEGGLFDISEGGAGIAVPQIIEVGSMVNLLLRIEGKNSIPFECDGMVTSCRKVTINNRGIHRVGIKFSSLPQELANELSKLP